MPGRSPKVWANAELLRAVGKDMDSFCHVFDASLPTSALFPEPSTYYLNLTFQRVRDGNIDSTEIDRGNANCVDVNFREDVFKNKQAPRSWDQLIDGIHVDFGTDLIDIAKAALLKRPEMGRRTLKDVTGDMKSDLFWKIVLNAQILALRIDVTGGIFPWLEDTAKWAAAHHAHPCPIFSDFTRLKTVGSVFAKYRQEIALLKEPRGYDREDVLDARKARARRLPGFRNMTDVSDDELLAAVPLPPVLMEFMNDLRDPEKARLLLELVTTYAKKALNRVLKKDVAGGSSFGTSPRVLDQCEVEHELLEMLVWRTVKNAERWAQEKREGATSWAPRLLNKTNLLLDAFKAIQYCDGKPANLPRKSATDLTDCITGGTEVSASTTATEQITRPVDAQPSTRREKMASIARMPRSLRGVMECYLESNTDEETARDLEITLEEVQERRVESLRWLELFLKTTKEEIQKLEPSLSTVMALYLGYGHAQTVASALDVEEIERKLGLNTDEVRKRLNKGVRLLNQNKNRRVDL